uniref:Carboxylic ester hydrolase n=1 Tax=Sphenodon punctatus TaxID=8508 RepID=A0A8D0L6P9_SPHPU
ATKYGKLRGQQIEVDGAEKHVNVFLGIPFAKPPIGPLRFSPPQSAEPWNKLRDATSYPPMCLQDPVMGQKLADVFTNRKEKLILQNSEDCLYLNIYTPVHSDKKDKLPVMVWIHGGGLVIGSASTYDGSVLAAFEDVVVVTIQHRLGILGYFSTGDEHARGNWGYLDQVAALQWIQENIEHFGGDPGSVTIFGESAGGASVSLLVGSPCSSNFKRLNTLSSSAEMVGCLKGKTEEEILNATHKMHAVFIPEIADGVFLPTAPRELLEQRKFNQVPYIIGVNNNEFGWIFPTVRYLNTYIHTYIHFGFISHPIHIAQGVHFLTDEYLGDTEDPIQLRDGFFELLEDAMAIVPSIKNAKYLAGAGNLMYVYDFCHRSSLYAGLRPDFVKADHGDEIGFVFGKPFLAGNAAAEERNLSRTVMKYWTNFARNGNPNGEGLVTWPAYDVNERYLEIDLNQTEAQKLKEKRVEFWTKILPEKLMESRKEHTK